MSYNSAPMVDVYILKGDGQVETFEPMGTYHGFRYAEIHGLPGVLSLGDVVAHTVHTAVAKAGAIVTSDPLVNLLQEACVRTIASNQMGMPTDCPQVIRPALLLMFLAVPVPICCCCCCCCTFRWSSQSSRAAPD